jgi:hypothetical protein
MGERATNTRCHPGSREAAIRDPCFLPRRQKYGSRLSLRSAGMTTKPHA